MANPIGTIGTPLSAFSTRAMLLGSGELGKEVVLELQRLGVETIAVDRYANAPAMLVANHSRVIDMTDPQALRALLASERPDLVVPEIEAIATEVLLEYEEEFPGRVIPTARATNLTMNREGIRRLAAEQLGLPTSPYRFAHTRDEYDQAVSEIGLPCVVKPIQSSSGHGQSVVREPRDVATAWDEAQHGARGGSGAVKPVIVEGFIDFDEELTILTVRHVGGVVFCEPIHHRQVGGDYAESWQGGPLSAAVVHEAERVAELITGELGGYGLFGVEVFVSGDEVIFSEVSPRPHDTGLVTLVSQDISEFGLYARAILGLPVAQPTRITPAGQEVAASHPIKVSGQGVPVFHGLGEALSVPTAQIRIFGKPLVDGERRVAVALARGASVAEARARAANIAELVRVELA